ncbi:MAG TPA: ribosomal RNA small subunit methyltransferase I [Nannocystaceae bacterium]|nr:ribosomal RNA small subunit methyltransferase I [Nannocystaceae bacterium]
MAAGKLVIVGTPLGHREDLSPRARAAILGADLLLCEDTRSPVRLLGNEVELPPRRSCFVGNEHERVTELLVALADGKTVAYISEAGMPGWSDPGQLLVREAVRAGHAVDVVPGPTAMTTAVVHSGFPTAEVRYVGFPPRGGAERTAALAALAHERASVVMYEAGNRVAALLRDLASALPDADARELVVARELTKLHQEVVRGTVAALAASTGDQQGEVTIVLAPATLPAPDPARAAACAVLDAVLDTTAKPRERARRIAALTGIPARDVYRRLGTPDDDT